LRKRTQKRGGGKESNRGGKKERKTGWGGLPSNALKVGNIFKEEPNRQRKGGGGETSTGTLKSNKKNKGRGNALQMVGATGG